MEPILRKNLTPAQVNTLLELCYDTPSESINENYIILSEIVNGEGITNFTFTGLLLWIDSIDSKEVNFSEDQVKEILKQFGETPYKNNHNLNLELMYQNLNQYNYSGLLKYDNIINWIFSQSKKLQKEHIKLTTQYDKTINEEASKFIEKYGHKRKLDENETT